MAKVTSSSLAETRDFARSLLAYLSAREHPGAVVLALYGDLGAGKTALAKELAALLGVRDTVNSPTFVLEKIYRTAHSRFKKLVHIDAYRLEEPRELLALGWEDILKDPDTLVLVEWADKVEALLPDTRVPVHALFVDENTRQFHTDARKK